MFFTRFDNAFCSATSFRASKLAVGYYGDGIAENKKEAFYWFCKSAEQDYALAQNKLGNMYRHGEGVAEDKEKAVYWYTKAAEQGYANA